MRIDQFPNSTQPMPLSKQLVLNCVLLANAMNEQISNLFKPYDISTEQFNVLRILRGQKGKPANMCIIQERMLAKTSNTTRLVDKLLAKELVTRNICPDNRRKMEVEITQQGLALLEKLSPELDLLENAMMSKLNLPEKEQFNALLKKLNSKNNSNEHTSR